MCLRAGFVPHVRSSFVACACCLHLILARSDVFEAGNWCRCVAVFRGGDGHALVRRGARRWVCKFIELVRQQFCNPCKRLGRASGACFHPWASCIPRGCAARLCCFVWMSWCFVDNAKLDICFETTNVFGRKFEKYFSELQKAAETLMTANDNYRQCLTVAHNYSQCRQ